MANYLVTTTGDDAYSGGDLATETADGGGLSLREAVALANADAGADTITFDASLAGQTITLAGSELFLAQDITVDGDIDGDDSADITISGNDQSRIFFISGAGTDVDLLSLMLTNGYADAAVGSGGAIVAEAGTTLDVFNTTISDSSAAASAAGGIAANSSTITLTNTLVTGNFALLDGGGIHATDSTLTLTNSTVDGNTSNWVGGGISINGSTVLNIYNSTVTRNQADADSSETLGGGISDAGSELNIYNSVIAENTSGTAKTADDLRTEFLPTHDVLAINSFFGTTETLDAGSSGNINGGGDPGLAALADNGGTILTRSIQPGSQLIDAGDNASVPGGVAEDANGNPRIVGTAVDIGATELQDALSASEIFNQTGKLPFFASLASAAYHFTSPPEVEGDEINEQKPNAEERFDEVAQYLQLLTPTELTTLSPVSTGEASFPMRGLTDGIYTNSNAAALVGRSADALFVAFRGTNDGNFLDFINPFDSTPDTDHWLDIPANPFDEGKADHYALFDQAGASFVDAISSHATGGNGITKVYVTGHSLGAAMAQAFMEEFEGDPLYEAITFASPGYGFLGLDTNDSRISNFWVDSDPIRASAAVSVIHGDENVIQGNVVNSIDFISTHDNNLYFQYADFLFQNDIDIEDINGGFGGIDYDTIVANARFEGTDGEFTAGEQDDVLFGTFGHDIIIGGVGDDDLIGLLGNDVLKGGEGTNDTARFDVLRSGATVNVSGGAGTVTSSEGTDTLSGIEFLQFFGSTLDGDGNRITSGGDRDDLIGTSATAEFLDGGGGNNTLSYANSTAPVIVNLFTNTASGGYAEGDTFANFQNVTGSSSDGNLNSSNLVALFSVGVGGDSITGDDANNKLEGLGGNDILNGLSGDDTLTGGAGDDDVDGGAGDDTLVAGDGAGDDDYDGGADEDTITYASTTDGVIVNLGAGTASDAPGATQNLIDNDMLANIENIIGGSGIDTLTGDGLNNVIEGGDAGDMIYGGPAGSDTASYASSTQAPFGAPFDPSLDGVLADLLTNGNSFGHATGDVFTGIENLIGSAFGDLLLGDSGDNTLTGGDGNDIMFGRFGADTIFGGEGNDTLFGDDASGFPHGTPGIDFGADQIFGGPGDDNLLGEGGADFIDGGDDIDLLNYSTSPFGTTVNLVGGIGNGPIGSYAEGDTYANIENVQGSEFDDIIIGTTGNNTLSGGGGDDQLIGSIGADILSGGAGHDCYVISSVAEGGDIITDFSLADNEQLHLQTLFAAHGLSTVDPIGDGTLVIRELPGLPGNTEVAIDLDGFAGSAAGPVTLFTLVGIEFTEINLGTEVIVA